MTIIEGIGDEVIQFFGALIATIIAVIAWWSTGIRERPQIRTVLILEHRAPNTVDSLQSSQPVTTQNESVSAESNAGENGVTETNEEHPSTEKNEGITVETQCETEPNSAPDKKVINEKRLAYFESQQSQPDQTETASGSSHTHSQNEFIENQDENRTTDNIRIRLKYLNDDQKLVEGRLQELLGDFKRRHFSGELSADKLVRLIFNGQVLQCDNQTLQGYGLYDNCVVHCLVHPQRSNVNRTNNQPQGNTNPPECNLGLLLYASVSVMLCVAWFFRYHYSQFFTFSSTVGLVILTALFGIMIIGFHMPDQETIPVQ